MNSKRKPILITGAHRSGSTWLANMLALDGHVLIAEEPFNCGPWSYSLDKLARNWFTYAPALPQKQAIAAFQKVLDGKTGRIFRRRQAQRYLQWTRRERLVIKDPIACFSSDWLARHFDMQTIVLVRHPGAFAASLKRMNWRFDFGDIMRQPQLIDDLLYPYISEIEKNPAEIVDQAALLWKLIYSVLLEFTGRHADWILVKHEKLSRQPLLHLETLYSRLHLTWSPTVAAGVELYTSNENPVIPRDGIAHQMRRDSAKNVERWKTLLTVDEIARLRNVVEPISSVFYPPETWEINVAPVVPINTESYI